jgi:hypothetical protein
MGGILKLIAIDIGEAYKIGNAGIESKKGYGSIGEFVSKIIPNIFIIAGVVFFFLLLFGGFGIITSGGNPEKNKQSSGIITAAITGFFVIFASYWLIQIIQYLTGINILNPQIN